MVDFGIHLAGADGDETLAEGWQRNLEELAIGEGALTSLWASDHVQYGREPCSEGWTRLTYLAALNPSYRVGHLVLAHGFRNPALLAKMAATLQHLSGGRLVLGLGAGWDEVEYRAYDLPFPSTGVRIAQLGDAIDLIRAMWTNLPASHAGPHYRVEEAYCSPPPAPVPPILIGGQGPKMMRLVAEKADMWVWDYPLEVYRAPYDRLVRSCAEIGRPLSEIRLVCEAEVAFPDDPADFPAPQPSGYLDFMVEPLGPTPRDAIEQLKPLVDLGVAEFIIGPSDRGTLRRFVEEVVPAFR